MITLIESELQRFAAETDDRPIVMLNLLRFRPDGGRERYDEYIAAVGPLLGRYGGELVYVGEGLPALSAEAGQAWDMVALVRYPSRKAFTDMVADPDYDEKAGHLREAALVEAVLQPTYAAA
ncbi:uncharacterized protein (DUF1330 family) [Sphingomonas zeicaulis]|uniref:DUF1330 domain-containing protein n=1 Tax=Sphingomonas zeicaulis TaxID=1632740 RepID=UPI003D195FAF